MEKLVPILYNIRSTYNVGAIFRTAACAGIEKLYLTGYTPTPTDRFGRARSDIAKVALGAENLVAWTHVEDINELIADLKKDGMKVVAVEQDAHAQDYRDYALHGPTALILGEEVQGIPKDILRQCDDIVEIPLKGTKESLNVSVAAGIALFRLTEQST